MNSQPIDTNESGETLTLPEPDPDNITVLTRNLPNKPILPWSHYDSPWQEGEEEKTAEEANHSEGDTEKFEQGTENVEQNLEVPEESDNAQAIADEANEVDEQPWITHLEQLAESEQVEETPMDELTG
ncbi:MAG: hypothetical protein AB1589_04970 [Cyanobacteriota bacterium]